jgi:ubiquinone/menaquinone biosynthesis C-methylase UbiE
MCSKQCLEFFWTLYGGNKLAERVCPWYIGYILANPLRNLFHNPQKILADYVKPGMIVLDIGSAMGFFSLGMARMVGQDGKVISVDLQEKMIGGLKRRAVRTGLMDRLDPRICSEHSLKIDDLAGQIEFALAFYVVHEVPDIQNLMNEIYRALKPGGVLYVVEPKGHASAEDFKNTENKAETAGFSIVNHPKMTRSWATVFEKK